MISQRKPLIGIVANEGEYEGIYLLKKKYVESIWKAGGVPILLLPMMDEALVESYSGICQGILLTGGGDINPSYFGEEPVWELTGVSALRDYFEISLAQWAMEAKIPLLGICRGCQVMNVAAGGGVIQHLNKSLHEQSSPRHVTSHGVELTADSRLASIYQSLKIEVNSFHHQAIGEHLGQGMVVAARSHDGVIEGIERPSSEFCVGVQWHPECLNDLGTQRLFSYFVQCAEKS